MSSSRHILPIFNLRKTAFGFSSSGRLVLSPRSTINDNQFSFSTSMASEVITTRQWTIRMISNVTLWFMHGSPDDEFSVEIEDAQLRTRKDVETFPLGNLSTNTWHRMDLRVGSEGRKFSIDIPGFKEWTTTKDISPPQYVTLTAPGDFELHNVNHSVFFRNTLLAQCLLVVASLALCYIAVDLVLKCKAKCKATRNRNKAEIYTSGGKLPITVSQNRGLGQRG
ncbi:uncharacterized protein [Macrobrachium rosenbergii]|uniref:uncharacterized protein n=1 Tax=Macrobrachium rosenbergii TaxID=79674 RepID=UPI0034D57B47